jgi:hypothetical protein
MLRKVGILTIGLLLAVPFLVSSEEALEIYPLADSTLLLLNNTTEETIDYVAIRFDQAVTLGNVLAIGGGDILEVIDILANVTIEGSSSQAGFYWGIRFVEGGGLVPHGMLQIYFTPGDVAISFYAF